MLGRRLLALVATGVLVALTVLPAQAALAAPANTWWYQYLGLAKVWQEEKGAGVTVAVIDSGVDASLGDLRGQVLPGTDLTGATPDGRQDEAAANFPGVGHGTDMATYIAGTGAGAGLIGVAPQAKILPVALGTDNSFTTSERIAQGIRYAVDHGADIVNISFGAYQACSQVEQDAVIYALDHDVLVVAASGDDGPSGMASPADCVGAIGVGATDSSFGIYNGGAGPGLDFVAPGVHLAAERLDGTFGVTGSGTSGATAIASGTFALLRAKFAKDSVERLVQRALYNTHNGLGEKNVGKRIDDRYGYGVILPFYALSEPIPTSKPNPIFAEVSAYEKAHGPTSTAPGASSPAPDPESPAPSGSAASSSDTAGSSDSSSVSPAVVVVIVVVVVGVVAVALVLARRRRT